MSVLSEILTNMLRCFSYTDFSEALNPSMAEGTTGARIVTPLKLGQNAPKRHVQLLGFRMPVWVHISVNNSRVHSALVLLPLTSSYQRRHLAAHTPYPRTPKAES